MSRRSSPVAIRPGPGWSSVPLSRMIRYGALLDAAGIVVVIAVVWLLAPLLR